MRPALFRPEVLAQRPDGRHGEVLIAHPPALILLVALAVAFTAGLAAYAWWGEYTRKEHVSGSLVPTRGLIRVFPPQAGTVLEKAVREGQPVRQGDVLLVLSSERASTATRETQAAQLAALRQRRDALRAEQAKQTEIDTLSGSAAADRAHGLVKELAEARAQLDLQRSRVAAAERTVARHEQLVAARFVAEATLQQKQEELLDQRARQAETQRIIAGLERDLATARAELASAGLRRANTASAITRQISELDQQLTETDSRRSVVITAPADGIVTTLLAEPGQTATPGTPLLSLLPAGAELQAQLLVPTRAAGFIRTGQEVVLRYQAFPYQRFGHHLGQVVGVGRSVIQPADAGQAGSVQEPVYRVTVRLPAQSVQAYGEAMALQAGMTLDADVRLDRRRLIEWLFDPLLSVTGRI